MNFPPARKERLQSLGPVIHVSTTMGYTDDDITENTVINYERKAARVDLEI